MASQQLTWLYHVCHVCHVWLQQAAQRPHRHYSRMVSSMSADSDSICQQRGIGSLTSLKANSIQWRFGFLFEVEHAIQLLQRHSVHAAQKLEQGRVS